MYHNFTCKNNAPGNYKAGINAGHGSFIVLYKDLRYALKQETAIKTIAMQKFTIDPELICADSTGKAQKIPITGQDARHMGRVLRLKPGDPVSMTDGRGTDYQGQVADITPDTVDVKIISQERSKTESRLDLTVCSAMLKDKKMDGIVRELTQIGVTSWIPFFSERSVPSPDPKKLARRLERWRTIARESLKQCRRSCELNIAFPCDFEAVLAHASEATHCIAFWEGSDQPLALPRQDFNPSSRALVLIGPEGGFTESEIYRAKAAGFTPYSLGPRILRAETAALTAAVLVQYLLGDLGGGSNSS